VRAEHGLRVFCSRILRRIFGPKIKAVTGCCRKLHYEELHDLCSAPYIVRVIISMRMRWTEHVARTVKNKFMYDFGGETRRKENTRRRMEDNIKIYVNAKIFQQCRVYLKITGAGRVI